MNALYFALRSGNEHHQLRHNPCQIQIIKNPGERPYTENVSKNHPGGLKGRKRKPKIVIHHSNEENPNRCFIRLFKLYNSLCRAERADAFYLSPLTKPKEHCWFSWTPLEHNTLKNVEKRICEKAGVPGYKTNYFVRATTATRLYSKGVDEQLVMECTGHRIRSYKWTSSEQQEISPIFWMGRNHVSMQDPPQICNHWCPHLSIHLLCPFLLLLPCL